MQKLNWTGGQQLHPELISLSPALSGQAFSLLSQAYMGGNGGMREQRESLNLERD